jgi:hypothetical protein
MGNTWHDVFDRGPLAARGWSLALVKALSWTSAAVAVHEGALAPAGIDLLGPWRTADALMPPVAMGWAMLATLASLQVPPAWQAWLRGRTPGDALLLTAGGAGLAAAMLGLDHPNDTAQGQALALFWVAYGLALVAIAVTVRLRPRSADGERDPWGPQWMIALWLPAPLPAAVVAGLLVGLSFAGAMVAALTLSAGVLLLAGLATAFDRRGPAAG